LMKSIIKKVINRPEPIYRKPTKEQLRRWSKMPDPSDVSEECRQKMWEKGFIV